jgi:hypothetical protein
MTENFLANRVLAYNAVLLPVLWLVWNYVFPAIFRFWIKWMKSVGALLFLLAAGIFFSNAYHLAAVTSGDVSGCYAFCRSNVLAGAYDPAEHFLQAAVSQAARSLWYDARSNCDLSAKCEMVECVIFESGMSGVVFSNYQPPPDLVQMCDVRPGGCRAEDPPEKCAFLTDESWSLFRILRGISKKYGLVDYKTAPLAGAKKYFRAAYDDCAYLVDWATALGVALLFNF